VETDELVGNVWDRRSRPSQGVVMGRGREGLIGDEGGHVRDEKRLTRSFSVFILLLR
jgi:hypothetical protein